MWWFFVFISQYKKSDNTFRTQLIFFIDPCLGDHNVLFTTVLDTVQCPAEYLSRRPCAGNKSNTYQNPLDEVKNKFFSSFYNSESSVNNTLKSRLTWQTATKFRDPRINKRIRIVLFSSMMQLKDKSFSPKFFCLLLTQGTYCTYTV